MTPSDSKGKSPKKLLARQAQKTIKIDYIKSNFFRVVHADGVYGGATPSGLIHMDVWSERQPIPQQSVFELETVSDAEHKTVGKLGDEIQSLRRAREGLVREVEVGVVLSIDLAKELVGWLNDKIAKMESLNENVVGRENVERK